VNTTVPIAVLARAFEPPVTTTGSAFDSGTFRHDNPDPITDFARTFESPVTATGTAFVQVSPRDLFPDHTIATTDFAGPLESPVTAAGGTIQEHFLRFALYYQFRVFLYRRRHMS
jgi:hypothetical protein